MRTLFTHDWALVRSLDPAGPLDADWVATNDTASFNSEADPGRIQPPEGSSGSVQICIFYHDDPADPAVDPATAIPFGTGMQVTLEVIQRVDKVLSNSLIVPTLLVKLATLVLDSQDSVGASLSTMLPGIDSKQVLGIRIVSVANPPAANKLSVIARLG